MPEVARQVLESLSRSEQGDTELSSLGISSLQAVDLMADIEERFAIDFETEELLDMWDLTLDSLQARIAEKQGTAGR